jgi:O-ureido-D-serine cyclo-ligase
MPRLALVTADAARALDEDLVPLQSALQQLGADVATPAWDDASIDWSSFDLVLLRSTWDYTQRLPQFLDWIERAAARTTLLNPPNVVRWNTDKHYLGDLTRRGVATVPSAFVEVQSDAASSLDDFLAAHADHGEFVVKPCVGAGSRDAQRYARADRAQALTHIQRLLDAQRSVLLQPYLDRVDAHGETALVFVDGQFSHAIRKGPLLRRGEDPTRALFAAEHITPRAPQAAELELAARTLQAMPFEGDLAYARIDLINAADGTPRVLELELTEPSLFFDHAAGSAARFAQAILRRIDF